MARAACHQQDDESSKKRVKWQRSFTSVDVKIRMKEPRSPSKALQPSAGHQNPENALDSNFCFVPPLHICLQAVILDVHVAVVSTKPQWHEVSARKESSQFFISKLGEEGEEGSAMCDLNRQQGGAL